MRRPRVSLVVAMDDAGLIGANNALPWRLSNDLKHFKRITWGKPIVMGRRTFQSIGRPLPGRRNIVLTRDKAFDAPGCRVVHTFQEAMAAADAEEVMVIGGADIYRQALPRADRIYLTRVRGRFQGDTYFPIFGADDWAEVSGEDQPADERNPHPHRFSILERRTPLR